jgi:hypothetical protein
LNVLVESLCDLNSELAEKQERTNAAETGDGGLFKQTSAESSHKLKRLNQAALDDESLLFGTISQNGEFKDGLLINMVKKACRV